MRVLHEALQKTFTQVLQTEKAETKPKGYISSLFDQQGNPYTYLSTQTRDNSVWILDSGCTDNMTGNLSVIEDLQPFPTNSGVRIADGTLAPIKGVGRVTNNSLPIRTTYPLRPDLGASASSYRVCTTFFIFWIIIIHLIANTCDQKKNYS
ncbi:hypothetical protein LINGRAPRIM_LOCUS2415 [Linum grandiflorum]